MHATGSVSVAVCSDLHVDTWPDHPLDWAALASEQPADVLLVAGDVHDDQGGTAAELLRAAQHYPVVVWVDGNHEAFQFGHSVASSAEQCSALEVAPNVTFLGTGKTLRVGHTLFVGCCAWWDFQYAAPECDPAACQARFNEVALPQLWFTAAPADGSPFDASILAAAERDYTRLRDAIAAAQADDGVRHIVVATHTVPHHSLLRKGVYPKDLEDAAMYGSSLMARIPEVDAQNKIALWVFGHSHAGGDARIGHIHYLGHPRGRPDDFGRAAYCPKVIHVGSAAAPDTAA